MSQHQKELLMCEQVSPGELGPSHLHTCSRRTGPDSWSLRCSGGSGRCTAGCRTGTRTRSRRDSPPRRCCRRTRGNRRTATPEGCSPPRRTYRRTAPGNRWAALRREQVRRSDWNLRKQEEFWSWMSHLHRRARPAAAPGGRDTSSESSRRPSRCRCGSSRRCPRYTGVYLQEHSAPWNLLVL